MSAVEEIQAAIVKLTELRRLSNDWQFEVTKSDGHSYMGSLSIVESVAPEAIDPVDADLIVTLHRTIDAQLVILRSAQEDYYQYGGRPPHFFANDVALARAINGGTQ